MPHTSKTQKPTRPAGPAPWRMRLTGLALVAFTAGIAIWALHPSTLIADVALPAFTPEATKGEALFTANCATCHGINAVGSDRGPPLLHNYYHPGHHGDRAFYAAAKRGVRQHHWRFGDMPALPDLSDGEIAAIVRYVRELQVANGIGADHR